MWRCITKKFQDIVWEELGNKYIIHNVPTLCCDTCSEELYPSDVQISISSMADKMSSSELTRDVMYKYLF